MKKANLLLSLVFLLAAGVLQAAITRTIGGTVVNQTTGEPVSGAAVIVKGTGKGVNTNAKGEFIMSGLPDLSITLEVAQVGFHRKDVVVDRKVNKVTVQLIESKKSLDEVTVITGTDSERKNNAVLNGVSVSGGTEGVKPKDDSRISSGVGSVGDAKVAEVVVDAHRVDMMEKKIDYDYIEVAPMHELKEESVVVRSEVLSKKIESHSYSVKDSYHKSYSKAVLSESLMKEKESMSMDAELLSVEESKKMRDEKGEKDKTDALGKGVSSNAVNLKAGKLTSGEVNDFSKWKMWGDIAEKDLKQWQTTWKIKPTQRYTVQVMNEKGKAMVNLKAELINEKDSVVWTTWSDNTGKAELWANLYNDAGSEKYRIVVYHNNKPYEVKDATRFADGINKLQIKANCDFPNEVDIAFVVDATGSMGDEIEYLKVELYDVIQRAQDSLKNTNFNMASVFYRDHTDAYLTIKSDFSADISKTVNFIKRQSAGGGGDHPEAVDEALEVAINDLAWRENTRAKMIFLVLDAPPHNKAENLERMKKVTALAAKKGIRIIPLACSGIDKSTEYLMRSTALATNGTYAFLTKHSGVGSGHIEPTTDKYDVVTINNLLVDIICNFTKVPGCQEDDPQQLVQQDTVVVSQPIDSVNAMYNNQNNQNNKDSVSNVNNPVNEIIKWKCFPNPTNGPLTIEVESGDVKELFLTDMAGKIMERIDLSDQNRVSINISGYPSGVYFIRFPYKDKWLSGKVVLMHTSY